MNALRLIRIMQFGDSVLPVGAFAFSNGMESAVQHGLVHNAATLAEFTRSALLQAATGDARAVASCCRCLQQRDLAAAPLHDRKLFNRKLNEESRMMIARMGKKLAEMAAAVTDHPDIAWWLEKIVSGETPGTYPITQALLLNALGATPREAVVVHLYGVAMTLLSAAMRLMRITHLETQRILFELNETIETLCDLAEQGDVDQMASYAPLNDVLAALHVGAFTRLFSN
ncbi:urease accessory protein UreF [Mixta tenebrionis]|uniref:Urease accessory protein UreF n=1 Tax=Mixta tenebrionis TaxID=2562439 RepID=A0A506V781_9GAMM|nr:MULTISPECIES: urease accessory protein UreF [Mixta]QHM76447.1 Urease accessory protein UreF [Mixta theicola]TPW41406.1 urease accessory protein UreF [Mixta tenebrionis]